MAFVFFAVFPFYAIAVQNETRNESRKTRDVRFIPGRFLGPTYMQHTQNAKSWSGVEKVRLPRPLRSLFLSYGKR